MYYGDDYTSAPFSEFGTHPSQFLISSLSRGTSCLPEDSSVNGTCPYSPRMPPTAPSVVPAVHSLLYTVPGLVHK